jgi:hypothetical protein
VRPVTTNARRESSRYPDGDPDTLELLFDAGGFELGDVGGGVGLAGGEVGGGELGEDGEDGDGDVGDGLGGLLEDVDGWGAIVGAGATR